MQKLGIFSWFSYPLSIEERLKAIKEAGFGVTSLWWDGDGKKDQPEMARKLGLEIDNIHTPFKNPNDLWFDTLDGEDYLNTLLSCIDDCREHDIATAVVHITGFSNAPDITAIGMKRVRKLVNYAEKNEVNLAFENLVFLQHLDYIFSNIQSEQLGFCYDSGHENFGHPQADCLTKYGDRLFALHLDDNMGDNDTHLLPYDGTVDWNKLKEKLTLCKKVGFMTLEVNFNPKHEKSKIYADLTADDFLHLAYERLVRFVAT